MNVIRNMVRFAGLAIGVPASLPHGLQLDSVTVPGTVRKLTPHISLPQTGPFTVAVDDTNVTVTRVGASPSDAVDVLVAWWHTFEQLFPGGSGPPAGFPFVLGTGGQPGAAFPPDRTIIVAKGGGQAVTIEAGIALANALVPAPSLATPASIWIFPGIYVENPLTIPTGVSMWGQSGFSVVIQAAVLTSPLVTLEHGAEINSVTLTGASGVGGIGLLANDPGPALARLIYVGDCTSGVQANGAGVTLQAHSIYVRVNGGALDCGFDVVDALLDVYTSGVGGSGGGCGVRANTGSRVRAFSIDIGTVESALTAENGGHLDVVGGQIHDCTYGFHIESTGGIIHAYSVDIEDVSTYDLYIEAANGEFGGAGNSIRSDQMSIAAGASVNASQLSNFAGDLATVILGELAVGLPNFPAESVFGEGDSHVREMAILRNTNLEVGVWSDITTEMASSTGSTADAFPGVGIGNALYIGGSEKEFPGSKIKTTAAIVLGAGSLIWEYWDGVGVTWETFTLMTADSVAPYASYAQDAFGRINFEQVRFDASNFTNWAQKALNGVTKWWVRCRVAGAITTVPVMEQIKLHTNRAEINADGVLELFGSAIQVRPFAFSIADMLPFVGGGAPGNANILYTVNITLSATQNVLADNTLDGKGAVVTIPEGLDTGQPVRMRWNWIPASAPGNPSQAVFIGHSGVIEEGDILNNSVPDVAWSEPVITTGLPQDGVISSEVEFDVSDLVPGEELVFTLARDATGGSGDTLVGGVELSTVELFGHFWR